MPDAPCILVQAGLVLIDRNTVAVSSSDITLTFASFPTLVMGTVR